MFITVVSLFLLVASVHAGGGHWEYTGETGPEHWPELYEHCGGQSQSPINIKAKNAVKKKLGPFSWIGMNNKVLDEARPSHMNVINNGHSVQVNLEGDYYVSGGGLPSAYKAAQFHYHWGNDSRRGSEHKLNGKQFPAEMHLVTYDFIRFKDIGEAATEPRGLAVFGSFIEVGDEDNENYNVLFEGADEVEFKDETYGFEETFPIFPLMSKDHKTYFRYDGSLTTPGCYESVLWTVFEEPVKVSEKQMKYFRGMLGNTVEEYNEAKEAGLINGEGAVPKPEPDHTEHDGEHHEEPAGEHHEETSGGHHEEPAGEHHEQPASGHHEEPAEEHHEQPAEEHHGEPAVQHHEQPAEAHHAEPAQEHDAGHDDGHSDSHDTHGASAHHSKRNAEGNSTGHDPDGGHDPHEGHTGTTKAPMPAHDDSGHNELYKKVIVNNFRPVQPLNGRKVFINEVPKVHKETAATQDCSKASSITSSIAVALVTTMATLFMI